MTDANPFECCICMNLYNDQENLPTTFPCGHSVCLVHVPQLNKCPFCRCAIPPQRDLHPTIALRDAAMLFARIVAGSIGGWQIVEQQISRHQEATSSSEQLRLQHGDVESERQRQIAADEAMARALHQEEQQAFQQEQERRRRQAAVHAAEENQRRRAAQPLQAARAPQANATPAAQIPPTRPTNIRPCPTCQRPCILPERLGKCCACLDRRPMQAEGTYPQYVDGAGWTNTGRRSAGYCPLCSGSHAAPQQPPPLPPSQRQMQQAEVVLPQRPPQPPANTPCSTCQKRCELPVRLGKCCGCLDRRLMQTEGTYPQYVDGSGWMNIGRRSAGYCPLCSGRQACQ